MVMFHSSVRHSSVNFPSFDYACFAPVSPVCMRGSIPSAKQRGKITEQDIFNSLPDPALSIRSAGIAMRTSEYSTDEVFLLQRAKKKTGTRKSWYSTALSLLGFASSQTNTDRESAGDVLETATKEDETSTTKNNLDTSTKRILLPPRWLFNEEEIKSAFGSFQKKLEQIQNEIEKRNEELEIPYEFLLPSKIPFGIAI